MAGATMRVLGEPEGFPPLPEIEISLYRGRGRAAAPVTVFADLIAETLAEEWS